jgi:FtsZ-interacting cell division protein ZipA
LRILAIVVGAITIVIIFAVMLWIAKRRSSLGKNITIRLQSTFLEALDDSNVNPRRPAGERHAE